jgi:hypothetical protein
MDCRAKMADIMVACIMIFIGACQEGLCIIGIGASGMNEGTIGNAVGSTIEEEMLGKCGCRCDGQ